MTVLGAAKWLSEKGYLELWGRTQSLEPRLGQEVIFDGELALEVGHEWIVQPEDDKGTPINDVIKTFTIRIKFWFNWVELTYS